MDQRYGDVMLPETLVADMLQETRKKTANAHFSSLLMEEIKASLEAKKQVILFRNRRGYVPMLICHACGSVPQCIHRSEQRRVGHECVRTCQSGWVSDK